MGVYPCQPKVVMSPFGSLTTLSVECEVSNCNCCSLGWAGSRLMCCAKPRGIHGCGFCPGMIKPEAIPAPSWTFYTAALTAGFALCGLCKPKAIRTDNEACFNSLLFN
jgi:hypothetical protein